MGDDFRFWRQQDLARANGVIAKINAWGFDLRHSNTEPMDNEHARTRELSDALLEFNNERLADNGGTRWVAETEGPPPIVLDAILPNKDVEAILAAHAPEYGENVHRITYDSNYYLCSKQGVSIYLGWSTIDKIPYQPDRHDCDNYAMEVYGEFSRVYRFGNIGVVIDWSSAHAYSFAIFADGDLWWIEPQSDQRVVIGKAPHNLKNALLIM